MKRYLLFGFDTFYPSGGEGDVVGSFDDLKEIDKIVKETRWDYYQILDLEKRVWIEVNKE